jgi:hypothetical protein
MCSLTAFKYRGKKVGLRIQPPDSNLHAATYYDFGEISFYDLYNE